MTDDPDNIVVFPGPRPEEPEALEAALEALLFASGEPVSVAELSDALDGADPSAVRDALDRLAARPGGLRIVAVAGGWQMRTDPRHGEAIRRLRGGRPQVMSKAALEALAVVAYRQPVTRADVDALRGVHSGGVLKLLLDKGYVKVVGRRDEPGRPLEYGTTPLFLELFELSGLDALPTVAEREALDDGDDPDDVSRRDDDASAD